MILWLCHPGGPDNAKQKRKARRVIGPYKKTEKSIENEDDDKINCNWCARNSPPRLWKGAGSVENQMRCRDQSNNNIAKISQNTEKSPRYQRKLAVTQTPRKYHPVTLIGKIQKS